MKSIIFITCLLTFVISCNLVQKADEKKHTPENNQVPDLFADTSSFPRIYEFNNGEVELNGVLTDIQNIERKIEEVSKKGTIIMYSSESPTEDPPKSGLVSDLFKKYKVNIKTYSDRTFTKSLE